MTKCPKCARIFEIRIISGAIEMTQDLETLIPVCPFCKTEIDGYRGLGPQRQALKEAKKAFENYIIGFGTSKPYYRSLDTVAVNNLLYEMKIPREPTEPKNRTVKKQGEDSD